jgi:hypothetical protein
VFISHDLDSVERLCNRAVLVESGRIALAGSPAAVLSEYRQRLVVRDLAAPEHTHVTSATITRISAVDPAGVGVDATRTGEPLALRIECCAEARVPAVVVESFVYSRDGRVLYCQFTTALDGERVDLPAGISTVEFSCAAMPLQSGEYVICASVRDLATQQILAWHSGPTLKVRTGRMVRGHFYVPHAWRHTVAASSRECASL